MDRVSIPGGKMINFHFPSSQTIVLSARLLLGTIFVYAGTAKILTLETFPASIASFELVPTILVSIIAIALPPIEILAGLCLVTGRCLNSAVLLLCCLAATFTLAFLQAEWRNLDIDCNCFGPNENQAFKARSISLLRAFLLFYILLKLYISAIRRRLST